jgi:hypothetical protein
MHSYANLIIYPFGHTNVPVPNAAELVEPNSFLFCIVVKFARDCNCSKLLVTSLLPPLLQ